MGKKIGLFLDVSNLYHCIGKKFNKRKLDYKKYLEFVQDLGDVTHSIAYGSQMSNEAESFIDCLKMLGYTTKFKSVKSYTDGLDVRRKADWDVGIALDIVNMVSRFDMVVLGSADGDLEPIVDWCMRRGVDVIILACRISRDLKESAKHYIEIPESLLEGDYERPKDYETTEDA